MTQWKAMERKTGRDHVVTTDILYSKRIFFRRMLDCVLSRRSRLYGNYTSIAQSAHAHVLIENTMIDSHLLGLHKF